MSEKTIEEKLKELRGSGYAGSSVSGPGCGGRPVERRDNVFAIASGKGGVGKTWFSITLAHSLAISGKRVLLFDGDLGLANVDIQLGLMPRRDLNDMIRGRLGIDKVIQRYERGGFDIVAGRSGQASLSAIPGRRLMMLRDEILRIAGKYDVVLLDLGAGVDKTVRVLSACASATYLVTTNEPTALTDAYAFIKLGKAPGISDNISIVVNQVKDMAEGERTYKTLLKACENFLELSPPLVGMVRDDKRVRQAIRHQSPILSRTPESDAAQDVEKIARGIIRSMAKARRLKDAG